MKTAKKVLSVLLAVMLVLGTLTVAASAFSDSAKVTWTLKAEVFAPSVDANDNTKTSSTEVVGAGMEDTYKSGSATTTLQSADLTAYKKVKAHDYKDNSDVIEVKAGDVVWVTVGFATEGELYPDMFENVLYYSSGLFYSTTRPSGFFVKLNGDWNDYGFTWTVTPFSKANATKRNQWTKGTEGYHAYFMNSYTASITDYEEALLPDIDEDIITIPVYVNPNAAAGTTGSIAIVLPNAFVPGVESVEGGDVYGNFEKVQGTEYHTGDVLNFKVVADTPSLDYDALDTAIAAYETKAADGKTYTTDTWSAATTAYNAAKAAKTDATTQAAIDTATANLNTALNALEEAVALDYTRINAALDAADAADTTNATMSSADAFADALEAALAAVTTATTQAALDEAAEALEDAIDGLTDRADMTALLAALADAEDVDTKDWTDSAIEALEEAVAAGDLIASQADEFSDQDAVDNATQAIRNAMVGVIEMANYTEVWAAQDEAATKDADDYTAASWAVLEAALDDVDPNLTKSQQAIVDGYAAAINDALDGLKEIAYTASLEMYVADANAANEDDYAADVWTAIQNKVALANTYIGADLAREDVQEDIDALAMELINLLNSKLDDADYSAVEAALAKIPADIESGNYTDESVAALDKAAEAVVFGLKENKQAQVDKMAQDLEAAVAGLELKKADLTALNNAITAAADITDASLYTEDSYGLFAQALSAAQKLAAEAPVLAEQNKVDTTAAVLVAAQKALKYAGADFSAIDTIYNIDTSVAVYRDYYTADSLADYDALVADALAIYANKDAYTIADQAIIDAAANKATGATHELIPKPADFTAIDKLVADANALDTSIYTEDSVDAFNAAFEGVRYYYNNKNICDMFDQEDIDAKATAGAAAFDLLVLADADYSEVETWANKVSDDKADNYTKATWDAYKQAIDDVTYGLKADKQDDVDDMAAAILAAYRGLKAAGAADYTEVDAQIAEFDNIIKEVYTPDSVAAVEDAIADVIRGLNENHQDEVDAMATAIEEAIKGLKEITYAPADYSEIDAAIVDFATKDQDLYTEESVQAVKNAILEVETGLDERYQAVVDGWAAAINAAIAALELKPVTPPTPTEGRATNVEYTMTASTTKTYDVTVEGRAAKIQFVDANGNTVTISRTGGKATIVSYDKDGNVVDDMSRDLAYEVWTTEQSLKAGTYTVIVKDATNGWEDLSDGYTLNVVNSTKNSDVISITPAASSAKIGDALNVQVVTGVDAVKIQILVDDATAGDVTFSARSYGTVEGDTCTYDAFVKLYKPGTHTLTVLVKTADGWATQRSTVSVDVTGTLTAVEREVLL